VPSSVVSLAKVLPKVASVSSASTNAALLRKTASQPIFGANAPLPPFWYDKGLIWQFINDQLPPNAVPVGADSYPSLVAYMRARGYMLPAASYNQAAVSFTDFPMTYFNDGEGAGGLGTVWGRPQTLSLAARLLSQLFSTAGLELSAPGTTAAALTPGGLTVQGPSGISAVVPAYLLMSPIPNPNSFNFFICWNILSNLVMCIRSGDFESHSRGQSK
jgi:hypothetical protein